MMTTMLIDLFFCSLHSHYTFGEYIILVLIVGHIERPTDIHQLMPKQKLIYCELWVLGLVCAVYFFFFILLLVLLSVPSSSVFFCFSSTHHLILILQLFCCWFKFDVLLSLLLFFFFRLYFSIRLIVRSIHELRKTANWSRYNGRTMK